MFILVDFWGGLRGFGGCFGEFLEEKVNSCDLFVDLGGNFCDFFSKGLAHLNEYYFTIT